MGFNEEFYNLFIGAGKEEIDVALKVIRRFYYNAIYKAYVLGTLSKKQKNVRLGIESIRDAIDSGLIYKPRLTDYFSQYDSSDVLMVFNNSSYKIQAKIRLSFVLDDRKELREIFPPKEIELIRYALSSIESNLKNNDLNGNYGIKYVDFYTLLSNNGEYSKEEIDAVFSTLDDKQKEITYKKLGESLVDTEFKKDLTEEEKDYFHYNVTRVMKRRLKQLKDGYIIVGIEDLFSGYSKDRLLDTISEDDALSAYYFKVFSENLSRKYLVLPNEIQSIVSALQRKRLIKRLQGVKSRPLKPFYSLFEGYRTDGESEEEFRLRIINTVNTYINNKCQKLLKRAYGENYDEDRRDSITSYERKYLFVYIVPRIKKKLEEKKEKLYKPFYDYFPIFFSKEEIDIQIDTESLELKELLNKKFRRNLSYDLLIREENEIINDTFDKIRKRLYKAKSKMTGIQVSDLKLINYLSRTYEYEELASIYGGNIALAVLASIYINDITEVQIFNLTGISAYIYLDISREYLLKMKGDNVTLSYK